MLTEILHIEVEADREIDIIVTMITIGVIAEIRVSDNTLHQVDCLKIGSENKITILFQVAAIIGVPAIITVAGTAHEVEVTSNFS